MSSKEDEVSKIMALFNKAMLSPIMRDKNIAIRELTTAFNEMETKFQSQKKMNKYKIETQQKLTDEYNDVKGKLKDVKLKLKIINAAAGRSTPGKCAELKRRITKSNKEIFYYNPEYVENSFAEDSSYIKLLDINMQCLEDKAYELKKRLIVTEQGNEVTDEINGEFGNVQNLVEEYKRLKEETSIRASEEKKLVNDAILKRRSNSKASINYLRNITMFYQKDLERYKKYQEILKSNNIESSEVIDEEDDRLIDFDSISKDAKFNIYGGGKVHDLNEELEYLNKEIDMIAEEKDRIKSSIEAYKETMDSQRSESSEKPSKYEILNQELFAKYTTLIQEVDSKTAVVNDLFEQLFAATKQKEAQELQYCSLFKPFNNLIKMHSQLMSDNYHNEEIDKTLYRLSLAIGNDMRCREKTAMMRYMNYFVLLETARLEELESETSNTPKGNPLIKNSTSVALLGNFLKKPIKKKIVKPTTNQSEQRGIQKTKSRIRITKSSCSLLSLPELQTEKNKQITLCRQDFDVTTVMLLLKGMKIGGYLYGNDKDLYSLIAGYLNEIMGEIKSNTHNSLSTTMETFSNHLNQLKFLTQEILVKEKHNVAIQVDKPKLFDMEVMTEPSKKK